MEQITSQTNSGGVTNKVIGVLMLILGLWSLINNVRATMGLGLLGQVLTFQNPTTDSKYSGLLLFLYNPIFLFFLLTSLLSIIFGVALLTNKWVKSAGIYLIIFSVIYYIFSIWSTLVTTNGLANGFRLYVPNITEFIMIIAGIIVLKNSKNTPVVA